MIVNADVVDGPARNRPVRWRSDQGARGEIFPLLAVAALDGIHHAPQHGAVWVDPGRHDPHQSSLILACCSLVPWGAMPPGCVGCGMDPQGTSEQQARIRLDW